MRTWAAAGREARRTDLARDNQELRSESFRDLDGPFPGRRNWFSARNTLFVYQQVWAARLRGVGLRCKRRCAVPAA